MSYKGIFAGLTTIDIISHVDHFPKKNTKNISLDCKIFSGGPSTNAAIAFSHFGNNAILISIIGKNSIANLIYNELLNYHIEHIEVENNKIDPPPIVYVITERKEGSRTVISPPKKKNENKFKINYPKEVDIVLVDTSNPSLSLDIAKYAYFNNIPVILDGGTWKEGIQKLLPYITFAICSENFIMPGCNSNEDILKKLEEYKIKGSAITCGSDPIQYFFDNKFGNIQILKTNIIDSLGAGDIFHGVFCHFYLSTNDFIYSLSESSKIATKSCEYIGPRAWMYNRKSGQSDHI